MENGRREDKTMGNRPSKFNPVLDKIFLAELAIDGNVRRAAHVAGLDPSSTYKRRLKSPELAEAWEDALRTAGERLEEEAHRRAVKGVGKRLFHQGVPVYEYRTVVDEDGNPMRDEEGRDLRELVRDDKGQPVQAVEYTYSDSLLTTLLKANLPHKYRENTSIEMSGTLEVAELSDNEKARRVAFLLQKGLLNARKGPSVDATEASYTEVPTEDDDDLVG